MDEYLVSTLFVSDLHLDAAFPAAVAQFTEFLAGPAREADALYILGDLFEIWVGDDDDDAQRARACAALRDLSDEGVACHVCHGNRDFLLGSGFEQRTGCRLLADPTMQDANRLEQAHRDAETRRQSFLTARASLDEVKHRLQRAAEETRDYVDRGAEAERGLAAARNHSVTAAGVAGIEPQHTANPLTASSSGALLALSQSAIGAAESGMRVVVNQRREDIAALRRRHAEVNAAEVQCGS